MKLIDCVMKQSRLKNPGRESARVNHFGNCLAHSRSKHEGAASRRLQLAFIPVNAQLRGEWLALFGALFRGFLGSPLFLEPRSDQRVVQPVVSFVARVLK